MAAFLILFTIFWIDFRGGIKFVKESKEGTMDFINRILVVSRLTVDCKKAIHYGISLARRYDAELTVLHVSYNPFENINMPAISLEREYKKDSAHLRNVLNEIIEKEKEKGMGIEVLVKEGDPVARIMKLVKEKNIDLTVLYAHGDSHWDRFIYGFSNDEIMHKVPCSVLLLKGDGKSS